MKTLQNIWKHKREFQINVYNAFQRYFGDWVNFEGHADVGYYLGARFVRYLLRNDCFENIINYTFERVQTEFNKFMNSNL